MLNANKSIKGGEGGLGTFAHKGAFVSTDAYNSSLKWQNRSVSKVLVLQFSVSP